MGLPLDYERRVDDEPEVRWRVTADGAFLHARGEGALVEKRRFDAAGLEALRAAIPDLAALAPAVEPDDVTLEERWSADGRTYVVYADEPPALTALRAEVDRLVAGR
jgi:hypothetical protein